jgi:hypothetical protein
VVKGITPLKARVLITAKTYPTLSRKYGETVCTAGIRENGEWVRVYPVPFRRLDEKEQYRKYDWLEVDLIQNKSDPRPETFRPTDLNQFHPVAHLGTEGQWRERRALILGKCPVYRKLEPLLTGAKKNTLSLATFKPAKVFDFFWEEDEREWDQNKVAIMRNEAKQGTLFPEEDSWRQTLQLIPKLPYSFSFRFADEDGRESTLQIIDWECGQLYWNCLKANRNDEKVALEKVKAKYMNFVKQYDLHFFLGTTRQFHGFSPNPWLIIGAFYPPFNNQPDIFA